jgi:hypothetical protein
VVTRPNPFVRTRKRTKTRHGKLALALALVPLGGWLSLPGSGPAKVPAIRQPPTNSAKSW